ncbi:MAG TPA: APC family permease [Acidimicrobiales bacterium]|nr:APC family permease [Acidimicrobiales bacterium]
MAAPVEMKRSLSLTGITVNAMALIAPGAFLWTTFQAQSALARGSSTTAFDMWTGLLFSLCLALLTAYSYAELARIYPDAGAGSSYYFAEAAFLDKEKASHRSMARAAKLTIGWISHLYYWIYPGIMVAFTATLFGYIWLTLFHHQLGYGALALVAVGFACLSGYIAFRGISGSTSAAIAVNVIQITSLLAVASIFIWYRLGHPHAAGGYEMSSAANVFVGANHSVLNLIYQSTIAILLLVGFESVTALGAEALKPEKDIKRGVLLSLIIQGGICYLFEYFATNFAVGGATISSGAGADKVTGYGAAAVSGAPVGDMLKTVGDRALGGTGTTLALIMAATVMLALIGTTLACLNTGVRVTYAMARDKEMPGLLGLLHGRFATPHGGILVLTIVSAAFGIYGVKSVNTLTQITLASNTGTFIVYGLTCLVALVAFASRHDKAFLKHRVAPALGFLMNLAEFFGVIYIAVKSGGATSRNAYIALGMVAVWVVAGGIWVAMNPKMRGVKLIADPGRRAQPQVTSA